MARTSVTTAIKYILNNTAGVTAIISTKSYAGRAPQETALPYVVFDIVSVEPTDSKTRPSSVDAVRVQVDCYATTYAGVEALNDAVRAALDAYTIGATVNGVKVDGIKYITENATIDEETDIFRRSSDYQIRIKY